MRFPGFQEPEDAAKAVAKLLRSNFWLPTLRPGERYARLQDDHDGLRWGILSVVFSEDADAWIEVDMNGVEVCGQTARFRTGHGGGQSLRTRQALQILAEAMRLDTLERAQDLSPHPSVIEHFLRPATTTPSELPGHTESACDERSSFEAYILKSRGAAYLMRNDPNEDVEHDYADPFIQEAWEAWQARAAAPNSTAKV